MQDRKKERKDQSKGQKGNFGGSWGITILRIKHRPREKETWEFFGAAAGEKGI